LEEGLVGSEEKCELLKTNIDFWGHHLYEAKVQASKESLKKHEKWERPRTYKKLQRTLGFFNYLRKYVPNNSKHILRLKDLFIETKMGKIKRWEQAHEEAFVKIKDSIKGRHTLENPNYNKDFLIMKEASDRAIRGLLTQHGKGENIELLPDLNKKGKFISFYSHILTKTERNYTLIKKELYTLTMTVKANWHLLLSRKGKVIIYTDHRNL
jgi:RNase H-like domain found in reverse transcriptase